LDSRQFGAHNAFVRQPEQKDWSAAVIAAAKVCASDSFVSGPIDGCVLRSWVPVDTVGPVHRPRLGAMNNFR
jgi:hypothetical protein